MIKQKINGLMTLSLNVEGSAGDISKITALMEGKIENYELKASGGTAVSVMPSKLNRKNLIVGSKDETGGRRSCYVSIPHVKQSVSMAEFAGMAGTFDSAFDSDVKSEYVKLKFDSNNA